MTSTTLTGSWLDARRGRPLQKPARRSVRAAWLGRARSAELALQLRSDEDLIGPSQLAARPPQARLDDADGATFWLNIPAAGRHNTEVIWNEAEQRATVAVWAHDVRRRNKGRMLAYAAFWLSEHDGSKIAATLARGIVTLRVPRR